MDYFWKLLLPFKNIAKELLSRGNFVSDTEFTADPLLKLPEPLLVTAYCYVKTVIT